MDFCASAALLMHAPWTALWPCHADAADCLLVARSYPFAMWLPRKAKAIEHTALGRFLNNFVNFSVTHMAM